MNDPGKGSMDLLAKAMRRVFEEQISDQDGATERTAAAQPAGMERRLQERLPKSE